MYLIQNYHINTFSKHYPILQQFSQSSTITFNNFNQASKIPDNKFCVFIMKPQYLPCAAKALNFSDSDSLCRQISQNTML